MLSGPLARTLFPEQLGGQIGRPRRNCTFAEDDRLLLWPTMETPIHPKRSGATPPKHKQLAPLAYNGDPDSPKEVWRSALGRNVYVQCLEGAVWSVVGGLWSLACALNSTNTRSSRGPHHQATGRTYNIH
eukprot:13644242-Alexandrium_andersonii.AAC.1